MTMTQSNIRQSHHPLEKTDRVLSEISEAKNISGSIMVSYCWLLTVPSKIFQDEELVGKLKRLDLSNNHISTLPSMMSQMLNLREIWLSYNPISIFPQCLLACKKLEVIDISHTLIAEVPTYVIDYSHLHTLDWRDTPLEGNLQSQYQVGTNDLKKLQVVMRNINIRNKTCEALRELLYSQIYLLDVDKSYSKDTIKMFVEVCVLCAYVGILDYIALFDMCSVYVLEAYCCNWDIANLCSYYFVYSNSHQSSTTSWTSSHFLGGQ